jgi:hypothetical protein
MPWYLIVLGTVLLLALLVRMWVYSGTDGGGLNLLAVG